MEQLHTHQSTLFFYDTTVEKIYLDDNELNSLSSVKNELHCLERFSNDNIYSPDIINVGENSYVMKKYSFALGDTKRILKNNIRRLLFSSSLIDIINQLCEIEKILNERKILHRDINPGNILFCEKEKKLKLIDFYWAITDGIEYYSVHKLNEIYGEDKEAFAKIKDQVITVDFIVKQEVEDSKKILHDLGKKYCDGSSKHIGKTYHPIDIHYYEDIPYHFDIKDEFQNVINNISTSVKTVIDVGCSSGFYLFNLMRLFEIKQAIGYEADPIMLSFLRKIKDIFCLDELELYGGIDDDTMLNDSDLIICMNVHMWLAKQFEERCDNIILKLIKKSEEMFFQTASLESSGKCIVKEFKTSDDIQIYLEKLGGERVELIYNSMRCGTRYLFKISKFKHEEN